MILPDISDVTYCDTAHCTLLPLAFTRPKQTCEIGRLSMITRQYVGKREEKITKGLFRPKPRVFAVAFLPSRFVRARAFTPEQKNVGRRRNTHVMIGQYVIMC